MRYVIRMAAILSRQRLAQILSELGLPGNGLTQVVSSVHRHREKQNTAPLTDCAPSVLQLDRYEFLGRC